MKIGQPDGWTDIQTEGLTSWKPLALATVLKFKFILAGHTTSNINNSQIEV